MSSKMARCKTGGRGGVNGSDSQTQRPTSSFKLRRLEGMPITASIGLQRTFANRIVKLNA